MSICEPGEQSMTSSELEGDVKKSLLDRPDAEKVFQPWWDSVEDYLLNILIALGDLLLLCRDIFFG